MSDTPTLDDIGLDDTREFGEKIKEIDVGDVVRATNNSWDEYVEGEVVEKFKESGSEYYAATFEIGDGEQARVNANWRDIPSDADDQETPYTGLVILPQTDTASAITDLEIVE
jgi:hypothetical protein